MANLPRPINGTEQYLAAIHDRMGELIDLLKPAPAAEPVPAPEPAPALVDLKEPAKAPKKRKG